MFAMARSKIHCPPHLFTVWAQKCIKSHPPISLLRRFLLRSLVGPKIELWIAHAKSENGVRQRRCGLGPRRNAHDDGAVGSALGGPRMWQLGTISVGKHAVGLRYWWVKWRRYRRRGISPNQNGRYCIEPGKLFQISIAGNFSI